MCNNVQVSLQVFTAQVLKRNGMKSVSGILKEFKYLYLCLEGKMCYREESTQTVNLLWILWSSIFVQFHHELFTAKEASSQFQSVCQPQNASVNLLDRDGV